MVAGTGSTGSVNGVGSSASFNNPRGMSTSPGGSFVLIADFNNNKIRKLVVSSGSVSTLAGSGTGGGGNGIGTSAQLNGPVGVSISSDGLFAVSSCFSGNRIRRIVLSTALVTTIAGDGSVNHVNGVGTNSRFSNPIGISMYLGDSWTLVADYNSHRVRLIDMSSLQVTTVAGSGTGGGANGIGTLAAFKNPINIAMSSNDEFAVVSEWNGNRVRKVVLSTWAVSTLAGSPSDASGSSDGVGTLATFNNPDGVVLTSDDMYVYVADRTSHKIRRVEVSSRRVVTLVSQAGSPALSQPMGITWLTQDWVLMVSNIVSQSMLQMYGTCAAPTSSPTRIPTSRPSIYTAPAGLFCNEVSQVVVAGTGSTGSVNGVGSSASFNNPRGMSTSPDGSFVLIADYSNNKIRKLVVSSGSVSTLAGSGTAGGGNGIGTSAQFYTPADVSISSDGLFALSSCSGSQRIRRIVLSTALVTTIAGDGSVGHLNGVGTNSRFSNPIGISMYSSDSWTLVADYNSHRVRLIDMSSLQVTTVTGSGTGGGADGIGTSATFTYPRNIAISSFDEFAVVSDSGNRVRKVVLSTWAVSTLAGSPSDTPGSSDGVGTLATFNSPRGLLLTSDDMYMYVLDHNNNKIRRVEVSGRRVVTLVSQAGSPALSQPMGITWLSQDSVILVSNYGSHRVLQMYGTCAAPTTSPTRIPTARPSIYTAPAGLFCNEVSQVVVAGTGSTGSANGVGSSASFNSPGGMSTSPDVSFLLIADISNHKVRKLVVSSGSVSTLAGSGTAGGGNGIGTSAQLNIPADVSISSDGLFALSSCSGGHRIRRIVLSTRLVTTIAGGSSVGHMNGVGGNSRFNTPFGISLYSGDSWALVVDTDNHRVRLIDMSSLQVTTVTGSGTIGGADGIGTSAAFRTPRFIAVSTNDEFAVVSEMYGHRVRKVVLSTWAVSTLAGSPSDIPGSSDGVGTMSAFSRPYGLLLTSDDMYVYVADRNSHKIRRVEVSGRRVVTLVSQAGSTTLSQPVGLALLSRDSVLMVSNEGSHRVLQMYGTCAAPTSSPTRTPTSAPSGKPSGEPSGLPTSDPTCEPSATPTADPSGDPSGVPTGHPSSDPTCEPSATPTREPTEPPTSVPTANPSGDPSGDPSGVPSGHPSSDPTLFPAVSTSSAPSASPVVSVLTGPTLPPTAGPTSLPQYFSMLKAYGGSRGDYVTAIAISASDWGSVLAGFDIGSSAAEYDGYLVKLDKCGEMVWSKSYGGPLVDSINDVTVSQDGSIVFVGDWTPVNSIHSEVMLGRADSSSGELLGVMSYTVVGEHTLRGYSLIHTNAGSVLVVGTATTSSRTRALVLLLDVSGMVVWAFALGGDMATRSYYYKDTLNSQVEIMCWWATAWWITNWWV